MFSDIPFNLLNDLPSISVSLPPTKRGSQTRKSVIEWSKESEDEMNVQATTEQNSASALHFFHKNLTWSAISRGSFYGTVAFAHALPTYKHLSVPFLP